MSYTFKNLANVELLSVMPENANVFVEVDGSTKRAPQLDVTGELVAKEALEEVPEGATVLAEVNGEIKRVPSNGLGGTNTIIFSVIELAGVEETPSYQTVCNYTPEEVGELMLAGARCVLIMPFAAMSIPAVLRESAVNITIVTMPSVAGIQIDDGSYRFMFFGSANDVVMITYAADGSIANSLLA